MQRMVEPGGEAFVEQIVARPIARIVVAQQGMQRSNAPLDQCFDLAIFRQSDIIIQTEQCQQIAVEDVCGRIDGHLLEENAIAAEQYADAPIQDVSFKSTYRTACYLEK